MSTELLVMAMTRMLSGICTAGFINKPCPGSGLTWVRPVKEFSSLLLGDMTDREGRVVEIGDVIALNLLQPRPDPTHAEDWLTDFVRQRPRLLRRLTGERRAAFLEKHVDQAPEEILCSQCRSLCLVRPQRVWATFSLDHYSRHYEARLAMQLDGLEKLVPRLGQLPGLPVTDLRWRALGRAWLADEPASKPQSKLILDQDSLLARLPAETIYLSIGLSRPHQGTLWPLVIGVHPVPDYQAVIDYENL